MNNLTRIQGKVIEVKPAKVGYGYYIIIREKSTSKRQGLFSKWSYNQGTEGLFTLRQDRKYFFIVSYQALEAKTDLFDIREQENINQLQEVKKEKIDCQLTQRLIKLTAELKQAKTEIQQWKNAYYNQKWMLKKAQQNAQQHTVQAKIQAIKDKPGKKSKQDLDYLQLLTEFNRECKENWAWLATG